MSNSIMTKQNIWRTIIFFGGVVIGAVVTALAVRGQPAVVDKRGLLPSIRASLDQDIRSYYLEQNPMIKLQIADRMIEQISQGIDSRFRMHDRRPQPSVRR